MNDGNTPLVSVILPTYNRESYLAESIESVLVQTYTNFELIIVNDCSTDHTSELLDDFRRKDQRIRVIENEMNKALSLSFGFLPSWLIVSLGLKNVSDDIGT